MAYKLPWMKFNPADWSQDTAPLSLSGRGAWITIICAMWRAEERGKLSMPIIGFCRLLGASEVETLSVIDELVKMGISDTVTEANKNITLICRRMIREYKHHKNNALRQERYRVTHQSNAVITGEKSEVRSQKIELREEKSKRTTTKQFSKPSPLEVSEYAKSIGFNLDGQKFCDYYETNGWKVGRNSMKSWQAAVRTWKNRDIEQGKFVSLRNPAPSAPLKKSFNDIRLEIITKLEESSLAGGDSISRCLSACNDLYRDVPKRNGARVVDEAYEIFKHRNKKTI
jgi:hypothetical protein